ncbi:unnamed protein product [Protopolystoma xenopodis]|uniref:Uncharacterized protein n=1 Tax=Protopolystoma xenopodis TaxID=117903 RepID=A0A448XH57_9PLAT|nr:unnamed protein product [Protopolystoma xenopodis]
MGAFVSLNCNDFTPAEGIDKTHASSKLQSPPAGMRTLLGSLSSVISGPPLPPPPSAAIYRETGILDSLTEEDDPVCSNDSLEFWPMTSHLRELRYSSLLLQPEAGRDRLSLPRKSSRIASLSNSAFSAHVYPNLEVSKALIQAPLIPSSNDTPKTESSLEADRYWSRLDDKMVPKTIPNHLNCSALGGNHVKDKENDKNEHKCTNIALHNENMRAGKDSKDGGDMEDTVILEKRKVCHHIALKTAASSSHLDNQLPWVHQRASLLASTNNYTNLTQICQSIRPGVSQSWPNVSFSMSPTSKGVVNWSSARLKIPKSRFNTAITTLANSCFCLEQSQRPNQHLQQHKYLQSVPHVQSSAYRLSVSCCCCCCYAHHRSAIRLHHHQLPIHSHSRQHQMLGFCAKTDSDVLEAPAKMDDSKDDSSTLVVPMETRSMGLYRMTAGLQTDDFSQWRPPVWQHNCPSCLVWWTEAPGSRLHQPTCLIAESHRVRAQTENLPVRRLGRKTIVPPLSASVWYSKLDDRLPLDQTSESRLWTAANSAAASASLITATITTICTSSTAHNHSEIGVRYQSAKLEAGTSTTLALARGQIVSPSSFNCVFSQCPLRHRLLEVQKQEQQSSVNHFTLLKVISSSECKSKYKKTDDGKQTKWNLVEKEHQSSDQLLSEKGAETTQEKLENEKITRMQLHIRTVTDADSIEDNDILTVDTNKSETLIYNRSISNDAVNDIKSGHTCDYPSSRMYLQTNVRESWPYSSNSHKRIHESVSHACIRSHYQLHNIPSSRKHLNLPIGQY